MDGCSKEPLEVEQGEALRERVRRMRRRMDGSLGSFD